MIVILPSMLVSAVQSRCRIATAPPALVPMAEQRSAAVGVLSAIIGWCYFLCWVATFYPQPILNYRRKRVSGLSLEFVCYQFTGFLCYSIFSIVSYILEWQYSADSDVPAAVRPNDIAFAVHALLLTVVVMVQYRLYTSTGRVVVSVVHRYILFGLWIVILFSLILALTGSIPYYCIHLSTCPFYRINLLSLLGYIKIAVNLVKNIPQLLLNHSRHSTVGWSIVGVLLDVCGSMLAFGQQALDAWNEGGGSGSGMVWGNVPKLLLSVLSFGFDVVFVLQHFVWYKNNDSSERQSGKINGMGVEEELEDGEAEDDGAREKEEDDQQRRAIRGREEEDDKKEVGAISKSDDNYHLMHDDTINATRLPT